MRFEGNKLLPSDSRDRAATRTVLVDGRRYKIGVHGWLFVWHAGREEWVRSKKHPVDVGLQGEIDN